MKQLLSYKSYYSILNLEPGCSWTEVRKSYKSMTQKWHPDRYPEGSKKKSAANDKIKQINNAYTHLQKFNTDNGFLPNVDKAIDLALSSTKKQSTQAVKSTFSANKRKANSHTSSNLLKSKRKNRAYAIISALVVIPTIYFISSGNNIFYPDNSNSSYSPVQQHNMQTSKLLNSDFRNKNIDIASSHSNRNITTENTELNENEDFESGKSKRDYFTNGSPLGEVVDIQGVPSKIDGNIWYYGKSEVHFFEGEVIKWVRSAETPLRARYEINPNR